MSDDAYDEVNPVTHRSGYVKDENKVRHGAKTEQVGLRLSQLEEETIQRVCAHWNISFTAWATYAVMRFTEYMTGEPKPWLSDRMKEMRAWSPPSPAIHPRSLRVATRVRTPFMQHLGDIKCGTAVRWVLMDEAQRALATPSAAARKTAEAEARFRFMGAHPVQSEVKVPVGHTWIGDDG